MKEAIDTLDFAIQDHPRLITVLKSQRVSFDHPTFSVFRTFLLTVYDRPFPSLRHIAL